MENKKLEEEAIELIEEWKSKFNLRDWDIRPAICLYQETIKENGDLITYHGAVNTCARSLMGEIIILSESEWSQADENCWFSGKYNLEETIITAMMDLSLIQYKTQHKLCMEEDSELLRILLSPVLLVQKQKHGLNLVS